MKINKPLCMLLAALGVGYAALGHAKLPEIEIKNPLQIQTNSRLLINALYFDNRNMFGQEVNIIPDEDELFYLVKDSDENGLSKIESISRICRGEPREHLVYDASRKVLKVISPDGKVQYSISNPSLADTIREMGKIPDC